MRDVHQLRFAAFMMTCFAAHYAAHYAPSELSEQPTAVLRDWCFVKLHNRVRKHFGFRAIGALVHHPDIDKSFTGEEWFSSEIRGIHSDSVVASNSTLYRLDGPAAPARHNAHPRLTEIMQPFCKSMWPHDAHLVLKQVSEFFSAEHQPAAILSGSAQRA